MALNLSVRPDCVGKRYNGLGHARGLACAKTKKFPCIFFASPPPTPPPRSGKIWKGIFWFCFAVSVSEKSTIILTLLAALFSALTATEAPRYPRFVVILASAHTSQPPRIGRSHSLTMPAWCLLRVRSETSFEPVVTQRNMDCAEAQTNLYVLAPPTQCAHKPAS